MILGFVMIKSAPTQTFIEQYLSPAVDGVSDRVKLSRLRRQIRTLSAFLYLRDSSEYDGSWMPSRAHSEGPTCSRLLVLCPYGGSPRFFTSCFWCSSIKVAFEVSASSQAESASYFRSRARSAARSSLFVVTVVTANRLVVWQLDTALFCIQRILLHRHGVCSKSRAHQHLLFPPILKFSIKTSPS